MPPQAVCPAILEAEGPVEEIDVRDAPLGWCGGEHANGVFAVRCAGCDRADVAAAEAALVTAAADLSRLCRRLL